LEDILAAVAGADLATVKSLVMAMVASFEIPNRSELLAQAATIHGLSGIPTMLEFQVDRRLAPALASPNPLSVTAEVVDADGRPVGMLVVWIDAEGYLYSMEFPWVSDERPESLPSVDDISPRLGPSSEWR
jgi:hypothetical protein